jgi:hypothetical protein
LFCPIGAARQGDDREAFKEGADCIFGVAGDHGRDDTALIMQFVKVIYKLHNQCRDRLKPHQ